MARLLIAALVAGVVVGGGAAVFLIKDKAAVTAGSETAADRLKASFARPDTIPFPSDNPYSEAKRALGDALFHDTRLSVDGSLSCATCHEISKGFADGKALTEGVPHRRLKRHTPTLWNLAYGAQMFWDGRARTLEEQAAGPITNPDEMAQPMEPLVARLADDPVMVKAFAAAFPDDPKVSAANLTRAIATYERSFLSPETRFDRFIAGDGNALTPSEKAGFALFTGKAGCSNCHSGFAFTDSAFHDIGLPGDDRGRGPVLQLDAADHAFKTPGLREIGRSAPYMHDGSLATLGDVLNHYENGIVERPTLSKDLPRNLKLTPTERADLLAFLGTLTSEQAPVIAAAITPAAAPPAGPLPHVTTVSQDDKTFHPGRLLLNPGERLWIVNNDTRTHNVRVFDPKLEFDSGAQEPGETVEIAFPTEGDFLVFCGIHPKMELRVKVGVK